MPRIPDVTDLGGRPAEQAPRPLPAMNLLGRGVERAAAIQAEGAAEAGGTTLNLADTFGKLAQAQERIESRRDAMESMRAIGAYTEEMTNKLIQMQTEEDFSTEDSIKKYGVFATESFNKAITSFSGTNDARARLAERLAGIRTHHVVQAAGINTQQAQERVNQVLGGQMNSLASAVLQDPGSLASNINSWQGVLTDAAGALTAAEQRKFYEVGVAQMGASAIEGLIISGEVDEAERMLLETPGLTQALSPEDQRRLFKAIDQARKGGGDAGFTLSPGQVRFDQQGRPIAAMPGGGQEGFTLGEGQTRFGPSGEPIAAVPKQPGTEGAFTLAPGQRRYGPSGEIIADFPAAEGGLKSDLIDERGAIKTETSGEIRRQTAQLFGGEYNMETGTVSGLSPEFARAASDLNAQTESIIQSGEANSIGQAVSLAMTRVPVPAQLSFPDVADRIIGIVETDVVAPADLETADARLAEQKRRALDVADATGIGSGVVNFFVNNLVGQLDPSFVDTDVVRARQKLAMLEGDFINSFNRNPRLPVWEQIRLMRIFSGPSLLRSAEGVRTELKAIDGMLTQEIETSRTLLGAPVPVENKQQLLNDIQAMAQFRSRIRSFEVRGEPPAAQLPTISSDEEAAKLKSRDRFIWGPTGQTGVKE